MTGGVPELPVIPMIDQRTIVGVSAFLRPAAWLTLAVLSCTTAARAGLVGEDFFAALPNNTWMQVPTAWMPEIDGHAGSAVDSAGGRFFLFGSGTHNDPHADNSVYTFDAATLSWTQSYAPDPLSNYTFTDISYDRSWTQTTTGRPWAMHVYDNMVYLPEQDALLVVSAPGHYGAAHRAVGITNALRTYRQTWLYDIASNTWEGLMDADAGVLKSGLFARGVSYNPLLNAVLGMEAKDTYVFDIDTRQWSALRTNDSGHGIHAAADFNPISGRSFMFAGAHPYTNSLTEYHPDTMTWKDVVTTGLAAPFAESANIAIDTFNDIMVVVAVAEGHPTYNNPAGTSRTMILDLMTNEWFNPGPSFTPPVYGLGFTMGYLEKYNVTLYAHHQWPESGRLWAYRYSADPDDPEGQLLHRLAPRRNTGSGPGAAGPITPMPLTDTLSLLFLGLVLLGWHSAARARRLRGALVAAPPQVA